MRPVCSTAGVPQHANSRCIILASADANESHVPCQAASKIKIVDTTVSAQCQLQQRQDKYKQYYDRGSKWLTELQPCSVVRVRHENVWEPAVVMRKEGHPRSYIVTREGREYRRNCRHLMNTAEKQPETT